MTGAAMRTRRKYSREEAGTYWLGCTTVWRRCESPWVRSDAALRQRQGKEPRGVGAYAPFRSWYPDQQFTARFMLHIFGLLYCNTVLSPEVDDFTLPDMKNAVPSFVPDMRFH